MSPPECGRGKHCSTMSWPLGSTFVPGKHAYNNLFLSELGGSKRRTEMGFHPKELYTIL